jgi:hypothetical protein
MKKRVEGQPHIVKDMDTGIIEIDNDSSRRRYQIQKENALKAIKAQDDIKNLKSEMAEIKDLLKQLVQK